MRLYGFNTATILCLQLLVLGVRSTGSASAAEHDDSLEDYISKVANTVIYLVKIRSDPEGIVNMKRGMRSLGTYLDKEFHISKICLRTHNSNKTCRDAIELCLRVSDLKNSDFDLFAEKCLEITNNIHIFREISLCLLSEIFNIRDCNKFLNLGLSSINRQKMYAMDFLKWRNAKSEEVLIINLCVGIERIMSLNENIEYTLTTFNFQDDSHGPGLYITGRVLPVARLVVKYCLKDKIRDITAVRFKNVTFTKTDGLFDFTGWDKLPQILMVGFINCKFPGNTFNISDDDAEKIHNTKALVIKNSKLYAIGDGILKLEMLDTLIVHGYSFTEIPKVVFSLKLLKRLVLCTGRIATVPKDIEGLTHLKILSLSNNRLAEFPVNILLVPKLEELNLGSNLIPSIPDSLSVMRKLSRLCISDNRIRDLTFNFNKLPLVWLSIGKNHLKGIPKSIYKLKKLKHLCLKRLGLESLPDKFPLNLQHSLTTLVLSGNKFKSFPMCLQHMSNLDTLLLDFNEITDLPEGMKVLPRLDVLSMANNKLGRVPAYVLRLRSLTRLNLSCNNIIEIGPEISSLNRLTTLQISENMLAGESALRNIANGLPNLEKLSVSKNRVFPLRVPSNIGLLRNLKSLNMNENNLDAIPNSISDLTNLTSLGLRDNNLTKLPPRLGDTVKLEALDLSNNNFTELPVGLRGMGSSLNRISMPKNKLTELPSWMSEFTSLTKMNFSQNGLSVVDESIVWAHTLRRVCLYSNRLERFPAGILRSKSLRHLEIANNNIHGVVPRGVGNLININYLDISRNRMFGTITNEVTTLKSLLHLNVADNQFTDSLGEIQNLEYLEHLNISTNCFKYLPAGLYRMRSLVHLKAFSNQIRTLSPSIGNLVHLAYLDLHSNCITSIPSKITRLASLEFLDVSLNSISTLPWSIGNLTALETLILSDNKITLLPFSFVGLVSLKNFYCKGNLIQSLPKGITELPVLKYIDVRDNEISEIDRDGFVNMRSLMTFYYSGNKIDDFIWRLGNRSGPPPTKCEKDAPDTHSHAAPGSELGHATSDVLTSTPNKYPELMKISLPPGFNKISYSDVEVSDDQVDNQAPVYPIECTSGNNPECDAGNNPEYDAGNNPEYDAGNNPQFTTGYNPQFTTGYNPQFTTGYNPQFTTGYNPEYTTGYNPQVANYLINPSLNQTPITTQPLMTRLYALIGYTILPPPVQSNMVSFANPATDAVPDCNDTVPGDGQ